MLAKEIALANTLFLIAKLNNVIASNDFIVAETFTETFTLWSYYYGKMGFVTHSGVIVKLPSNKG